MIVQGYACSTAVDRVTLLSLLSLNQVDRYETSVAEAVIDGEPDEWRWCVNPRCRCVLRRTDPPSGELTLRAHQCRNAVKL